MLENLGNRVGICRNGCFEHPRKRNGSSRGKNLRKKENPAGVPRLRRTREIELYIKKKKKKKKKTRSPTGLIVKKGHISVKLGRGD